MPMMAPSLPRWAAIDSVYPASRRERFCCLYPWELLQLSRWPPDDVPTCWDQSTAAVCCMSSRSCSVYGNPETAADAGL